MAELNPCAWCGEKVDVIEKVLKKDYGEVKERRCSRCEGILAAYLVENEPVLPEVRVFKD